MRNKRLLLMHGGRSPRLFTRHGHRAAFDSYPFHAFLGQGAERTTPRHQKIVGVSSLDSFLFPGHPPDLADGPETDASQHGKAAVHHTALAVTLSILSSRVARSEVSDDTNSDVGETSADSNLPFTHFVINSFLSSNLKRKSDLKPSYIPDKAAARLAVFF